MQPGEYGEILTFTDAYVYYVEADGYMTGYAEEKIAITSSNRQKINKLWEAVYGTYNYGTTIDQWAEIVWRRRREYSRDTASSEYGGRTESANRLYAGEQDSNGARDFERDQQDSWEIDYESLGPGIMWFDGERAYQVVETEGHYLR